MSQPNWSPTVAAIRAAMAARGLTQAQAAQVLGIAQTNMSLRLRGRVDFTVTEVRKLAAWMDVPPSQFLPEDVLVGGAA